MYLRRKIDIELEKWLQKENNSPALVIGIRQCGKTKSIKEFAKKHFKYVNYINFWENSSYKDAFSTLNIDDILKKLSFESPDFKFVPNETIIILDEIQDCSRARLSLKSFKEDGRYQVIASGSFIGINIDSSLNLNDPKPNGAEDIIEMKTMDFEEFLWANNYTNEQINTLLTYFTNKEKIPNLIHEKMKNLFKEYICIGGYPEVVLNFITNKSFSDAYKKNESLIFDIKGDPSKRKDDKNNPLYTSYEISRIQNAFDLVASFSLNDNKRFVISKINGGNGIQKNDAINYLMNSNVVFKAYNVTVPSLPLKISMISSQFKLFYCDIGMMTTTCGFETIKAIMKDQLGMNKGYLYESIVAESLYKANIPLYYFEKNSGLEIDLVISYNCFATLIEVKAKTGNTKSSKTVLSHPEHYGITKLIKFGDYNIGYENDILTLPYYLAFALGKDYENI